MASTKANKKNSSKKKPVEAAKSAAPVALKTEEEKKKILEARIERARVDIQVAASAATIKAAIAASPEVTESPMPVVKLLSEAKQAVFNAENDLEKLCERNYDFKNIGLIRGVIAEVERLHVLAAKPRGGKRTPKEIATEAKAKDWREKSLDDIELATDGDPNAAAWASKVREGEGIDDLLDDAGQIVSYAPNVAAELEAIGVDAQEIVAEGKEYIELLTPEVLKRRAETTAVSFVPQRNRAANTLYLLVNRLYKFGRNVFRKQPTQARAYASTYSRVRKAVYRAKKTREQKKLLKAQG